MLEDDQKYLKHLAKVKNKFLPFSRRDYKNEMLLWCIQKLKTKMFENFQQKLLVFFGTWNCRNMWQKSKTILDHLWGEGCWKTKSAFPAPDHQDFQKRLSPRIFIIAFTLETVKTSCKSQNLICIIILGGG